MYWSSKNGSVYPYKYNQAGDIFLHNAIEARMMEDQKTLYISSDDEVWKYELEELEANIFCYSEDAVQ